MYDVWWPLVSASKIGATYESAIRPSIWSSHSRPLFPPSSDFWSGHSSISIERLNFGHSRVEASHPRPPLPSSYSSERALPGHSGSVSPFKKMSSEVQSGDPFPRGLFEIPDSAWFSDSEWNWGGGYTGASVQLGERKRGLFFHFFGGRTLLSSSLS